MKYLLITFLFFIFSCSKSEIDPSIFIGKWNVNHTTIICCTTCGPPSANCDTLNSYNYLLSISIDGSCKGYSQGSTDTLYYRWAYNEKSREFVVIEEDGLGFRTIFSNFIKKMDYNEIQFAQEGLRYKYYDVFQREE